MLAEKNAGNVKYVIKEAYLVLPLITFSDSYYSNLKSKLSHMPCTINYSRPEMLIHTISQNSLTYDNINLNFLHFPTRIILVLVDSKVRSMQCCQLSGIWKVISNSPSRCNLTFPPSFRRFTAIDNSTHTVCLAIGRMKTMLQKYPQSKNAS